MMKSGLLIGGNAAYLGKLAEEVRSEEVSLFVAASLDDVKRILENEAIDIVILGRESDPEYRLRALSHILAASPNSSIHLMGTGGNPLQFVSATLQSCQTRDSDSDKSIVRKGLAE